MKNYFQNIGALPRHTSFRPVYTIGYTLSIICTLAAYVLVDRHVLAPFTLIAIIIVLAIVQITAQVYCFLHLDFEKHSRLKLIVFSFAILVVGILVSGSLWIMTNVQARMTSDPTLMEAYMQNEGGF